MMHITRTDCPYCHNKNIEIRKEYDKEVMCDDDNVKFFYGYDHLLDCFCDLCKTHYRVNKGSYRYYVYDNYFPTNSNDVKKLVTLRSDFERGYDIISVLNEKEEEVFMFIPYVDRYPLILSKEKVDEIINTPEVGKKLSKQIYSDRYNKEM